MQVDVISFPDPGKRWGEWIQLSVSQIQPGFKLPDRSCTVRSKAERLTFWAVEARESSIRQLSAAGPLQAQEFQFQSTRDWSTRSSNTNDSCILLGVWKQVRNSGFRKGVGGQRAALKLDQSCSLWEDRELKCERMHLREGRVVFQRHEKGSVFTPPLITHAPWPSRWTSKEKTELLIRQVTCSGNRTWVVY